MSSVLIDYKGLLLFNIKYKISLILYIALHRVLKILKCNFGIFKFKCKTKNYRILKLWHDEMQTCTYKIWVLNYAMVFFEIITLIWPAYLYIKHGLVFLEIGVVQIFRSSCRFRWKWVRCEYECHIIWSWFFAKITFRSIMYTFFGDLWRFLLDRSYG